MAIDSARTNRAPCRAPPKAPRSRSRHRHDPHRLRPAEAARQLGHSGRSGHSRICPTPRPGFRIEKDPLGYLEVPDAAYYGVQTARGIHNFPISGTLPHRALVRAIVQVKKAAARANMATGRLPKQLGNAIVDAADEILQPAEPAAESDELEPRRPSDPMRAAFAAARAAKQAELIDNFRIDPFQAGAGTSHNMNANEVLANRAIELLHAQGVGSGKRGDYSIVSPNDHVNMAQSTNDVFPTAMRIATLDLIRDFMPAAGELIAAFEAKAREFDDVIKSGRTHMQDAVPIRLGQEFAAYALTLRRGSIAWRPRPNRSASRTSAPRP